MIPIASRAARFGDMFPVLTFYWMDEPIPHFAMWEIACRGCGLIILQPKLLVIECEVREEFGEPIKVHSWCRCITHNEEEGGKFDSYHIPGKAIDQSPKYGPLTHRFIEICRRKFPMILVYNTFCHCDIRGGRDLN